MSTGVFGEGETLSFNRDESSDFLTIPLNHEREARYVGATQGAMLSPGVFGEGETLPFNRDEFDDFLTIPLNHEREARYVGATQGAMPCS
jgi:hypothetical protein